jgi:hypothetical protein
VLLRLALTTPLAVIQRRRVGRWLEVQKLVEAWENTIKQGQKRQRRRALSVDQLAGANDGDTSTINDTAAAAATAYRQKVQSLYKTYQCHPLKTFVSTFLLCF